MDATAGPLTPDSALVEIEDKFLAFAGERAATGAPQAAKSQEAWRSGAFSQYPGQGAPDLFGALDIAYAAHILGLLDRMTDEPARQAWAERILAFQSDDGWFRAGDRQGHSVEHATAYALGALQLLTGGDGSRLAALKPFSGLSAQLALDPGPERAPFALSTLDRTHFWRGSHRAGGIPAIVRAVDRLGLDAQALLGLPRPGAWLDGWWAYFAPRIDPRTGYWRLSPWPLQAAFDRLYRRRHDPVLARMGGAVHLYWVSESLGKPMPHPAALVTATAGLIGPNGLYEGEPYCIDLDANFLIGRALDRLPIGDPAAAVGRRALRENREAIVDWYLAREPSAWNASAHKLPGAFAAVAEADRALVGASARWRDVFKTTCWL